MKKSLIEFFDNPRIKEKIDSEQFDLSNILINKRVSLDLEFTEIAKIAGFTNNEYIKMEYGDIDVPIKDFNKAIDNISKWEKENCKWLLTTKKTRLT